MHVTLLVKRALTRFGYNVGMDRTSNVGGRLTAEGKLNLHRHHLH